MVSQHRVEVVGHRASGSETFGVLGFLTDLEQHPWKAQALCAQTDPEAFFPENGGTTAPAKAVCRACEVSTQCLAYALEREETHGIWGGLSYRERRKLLHSRRREREAS